MKWLKLIGVIVLFVGVLSACQPFVHEPTSDRTGNGQLVPYTTSTETPTLTFTPQISNTATLAPTRTSTPKTYVLKSNDTLFSIAARNGITVVQLEAANPGINAYSLSVGKEILIPAPGGNALSPSAPTPTPVPVVIDTPVCFPSQTGALHCWVLVSNELDFDLESLTAEFQLVDSKTNEVRSQVVLLPLNLLPSGKSLPFYSFFSPPITASTHIDARLLSAVPVEKGSTRTIPLEIQDLTVKLMPEAGSAILNGSVGLPDTSKSVKKYWILAIAYSPDNTVIGMRRTEMNETISKGSNQPFDFEVFSIVGTIDRVEVYAEGAP
jgi:LysM repeat protein